VPPADLLPERLEALLAVIYLIFNEGYVATSSDALTRHELCREAIRLCRVLVALLPTLRSAEARGLLALMLLHDSRREARLNAAASLSCSTNRSHPVGSGKNPRGVAVLDEATRPLRSGPPIRFRRRSARCTPKR